MFYSDGLNFECQRCMYCCSSEPGYVFLSHKDLERLSSFFGQDVETFIDIYCRLVDFSTHYLVSLTEKKNYDCEFLSKSGCTVYEARPEQCRTYPFWKSVLQSSKTWETESSFCPGINKGRKILKSEIEEALKRDENNPPYMIINSGVPLAKI